MKSGSFIIIFCERVHGYVPWRSLCLYEIQDCTKKIVLCIWWNMKSVICHILLSTGSTTADFNQFLWSTQKTDYSCITMQNYSFQNVCNYFVGWKDKKRQRYYEKKDRYFFSKPNQFYVKSINNLPSHWDYIIKNAGKYIDWTDSWSLNTSQIC